jgi:hypothetical protein
MDIGTAADYWIQENNRMEWVGSATCVGHYPGAPIMEARSADGFRTAVMESLLLDDHDQRTGDVAWPGLGFPFGVGGVFSFVFDSTSKTVSRVETPRRTEWMYVGAPK